MCPEKSRPQENKEKTLLGYTHSVDAWAIGVLGYELIVGQPPFERDTRLETYEQIMYHKPHYPAWLSDLSRSFISAALTKVGMYAPVLTAHLRVTHALLTQSTCTAGFEHPIYCLQSARKRPSAGELLCHPWVLAHQWPDRRPPVAELKPHITLPLSKVVLSSSPNLKEQDAKVRRDVATMQAFPCRTHTCGSILSCHSAAGGTAAVNQYHGRLRCQQPCREEHTV